MLTRTWEARDFDTGNPLKSHLLGHMSQLEVHHVFPKSLLRKHGYKPGERNALANFTFLTKDTNLLVGDRAPAEYLADYASKHPGVVESHWIPMDPALWQLENYPEFLARRRELLAAAANQFLDSLQGGTIPQTVQMEAVLAAPLENVRRHPSQEAEEAMLDECSDWIATHGLPPGERNFELIDRETQEVIATVDLAWPSGLQEGLSKPVALLLGESSDTRDAVSEADFRCFTDMESFRTYVEHDVLVGDDEDADGDAGGGTLRTLEDWRARTSPITVGLAERLLSSINEHVSPRFGRTYQLNPRVHFIGLSDGDRSRNFVMFKPRKGFLRILATVPGVDGWVDRLEAAGLPANARGMRARVNVTPDDFRRCEATLVELVVQAADEHHV
jgi:hypothetical protein